MPQSLNEIAEILRALIAAQLDDAAPDEIDPNLRLREDLHLDSLDAVSILIGIEQRTGIILTDTDARQLTTAMDAARLIHARQAGE